MITVQALVNMGVSVRLFPTTGQPLPLVSYGGTSLLFTCLSLGMMLAVTRVVQQDPVQAGTSSNGNTLT
jgi:cell division protein FtsW